MKDKEHVIIRDKIEKLLNNGISIENIALKLNLCLGNRYIKKSAKWYNYCIAAKSNQKKAIQKHPNIYSDAGKIAQKKHPWIGKMLGKKYGPIQGKINAKRLKGNKKYFSFMAKRLHELYPDHSRRNMIKAHQIMKNKGTFYKHQIEAGIICKNKHPDHYKKISKIAHELYPLAILALESRRKNYPYKFMNCLFDSESEKKVCNTFVTKGLINNPIEGENVHIRMGNYHIDFFY